MRQARTSTSRSSPPGSAAQRASAISAPTSGRRATVEYVTHTPHGFRTGDLLLQPLISGGTPGTFPIQQGTGDGSLSGTVSVLNGSTAITFSTSQTLGTNQGLTFGSDSTGQGYRIGTGGTGTAFTLLTPYEGATAAASTATATAVVSVGSAQAPIVVTGSSTYVFACANYFTVPNTATLPIQLNSTSQIPLSGVSCTLDGTSRQRTGPAPSRRPRICSTRPAGPGRSPAI